MFVLSTQQFTKWLVGTKIFFSQPTICLLWWSNKKSNTMKQLKLKLKQAMLPMFVVAYYILVHVVVQLIDTAALQQTISALLQ